LSATFGYIFSRSILSKLDDEEEVVGARKEEENKQTQQFRIQTTSNSFKQQQFYK
jgi:hypothetical protein